MATYRLGRRSLAELQGVHCDLVAVVKRAIELTPQDFSVHDGIRTLKEQQRLVECGASKTLRSRHLSGHAVDLVPYINGKLRWEWEPIYLVADAMRTAAQELGMALRWGGAWDREFHDCSDCPEDMLSDYACRRREAGKRVFLDGPHFELPARLYPD